MRFCLDQLLLMLPKNVAELVYSFYHVSTRSIEQMAKCGDWEQVVLRGICEGGHTSLIDYCVSIGLTKFDGGLQGAIRGTHRDIAIKMIQLGANPATGLIEADERRDMEMVAFMLTFCERSWRTEVTRMRYHL
jgi:hypothetical protein